MERVSRNNLTFCLLLSRVRRDRRWIWILFETYIEHSITKVMVQRATSKGPGDSATPISAKPYSQASRPHLREPTQSLAPYVPFSFDRVLNLTAPS